MLPQDFNEFRSCAQESQTRVSLTAQSSDAINVHVSLTTPLDLYEFLRRVKSSEDLGQWSRLRDRIGSEETCEETAQISLLCVGRN